MIAWETCIAYPGQVQYLIDVEMNEIKLSLTRDKNKILTLQLNQIDLVPLTIVIFINTLKVLTSACLKGKLDVNVNLT